MNTLNIKNMVCDRCITTVRTILQDLGFTVDSIALGKATIIEDPEIQQLEKINTKLRQNGFELIHKSDKALIEQIKTHLIEYLVYIENSEEPEKLSKYLSEHLHHNYSYLSHQFSTEEDITIEQHFINLKIERVKELLSYKEMTLSEIAWKLNYSSVQYLSNQFKKITGETASTFRKTMDTTDRQSLDTIR